METYNLTPSEMKLWQEGLRLCGEIEDLKAKLLDTERKLAISKTEVARLEEEKKAWKKHERDNKKICPVVPCAWEITNKTEVGPLRDNTGCREFREELRKIKEDARKAEAVSQSLHLSLAKYDIVMRKMKREIGVPFTSFKNNEQRIQQSSKEHKNGQCRWDTKGISSIGRKTNKKDVEKLRDITPGQLRAPSKNTESVGLEVFLRGQENSKESEGGTKQGDVTNDHDESSPAKLGPRKCLCQPTSHRELAGLEDELRKAVRLTEDTQELMKELFSAVNLKDVKRVMTIQQHSHAMILASISRISKLSNKKNVREEDLHQLKATLVDALYENPTERRWCENEGKEVSWINALIKKLNFGL